MPDTSDDVRTTAGPAVAVVLFTDVVGSTEQRIALGEERAESLRRVHDRLVTDVITAHRGVIVKGVGDGFHSVFASSADACDAAVVVHAIMASHSASSTAVAPLRVRVGISAGDVVWDDVAGRTDCYGLAVVEAARLTALCDPSETICTEAVRSLARGRGQHRFLPRGIVLLRGFSEPVAVSRVVAPIALEIGQGQRESPLRLVRAC